MKKLILSILLVAVTGFAMAQNYADESFRQMKRQERQAAMEAKLQQAITSQNFSFTANTMQANIGVDMPVPYQHNYVDVYPSFIETNVPYLTAFAVVQTPNLFKFTANSYTYTAYDAGNKWIVVIKVDNAINAQDTQILQSGNYNMHFSIYKSTGITTLTITPSMSDAMTYQGFINAN